jgi:hypothetical protein
MSSEEHTPYFSKRIRIGDVTSPKDLVGFKDFTVELTFGNQEIITIKNKDDVAEVLQQKNLFDMVEELYSQRDEWAAKRGFKFVDQYVKEEKP